MTSDPIPDGSSRHLHVYANTALMAPVATEHERGDALAEDKRNAPRNGDASHTSNEDDEEDEEEPRLKYTSLTKNLTPVYRNGDETSTFLVGGDKLVQYLSPKSCIIRGMLLTRRV